MPRTHCVLSCESNAGAVRASKVSTFCFPKDEKKKKLWIRSINSENRISSSNSTKCIRHFRKNFISNGKPEPKLACNAHPSVSSEGFCCQNPGENKNISHAGEEQHYVGGVGTGWSSASDKLGVPDTADQIILSEDTEMSQGCITLVDYDGYGVGSQGRVVCRLRPLGSSPKSLGATSYPLLLQTALPSQLQLPPLPEPKDENTTIAIATFKHVVTPEQAQDTVLLSCEPVSREDEEPTVEEIEVIESCCVSGCFSNLRAPLVTMFPFPDDESQKKLWLKRIYREDYVPTKFSAVCIHHFREEYIVRTIGSRRRNGSVVDHPLDKPSLAPGAFPSLFIQGPPVLQRRIECPVIESRELGLHEEYMVKEENDIQEAWVNIVKEENENQEAWVNSVEEEKQIDEQWFRSKTDVDIFLSSMTVKKESKDEVCD